MSPKAISVKQVVARRSGVISVSEHCPDRPYVELEIPRDFHAVRYVDYTTDAHDQGKRRPRCVSWPTETCQASVMTPKVHPTPGSTPP